MVDRAAPNTLKERARSAAREGRSRRRRRIDKPEQKPAKGGVPAKELWVHDKFYAHNQEESE